MDYLTLFKRW